MATPPSKKPPAKRGASVPAKPTRAPRARVTASEPVESKAVEAAVAPPVVPKRKPGRPRKVQPVVAPAAVPVVAKPQTAKAPAPKRARTVKVVTTKPAAIVTKARAAIASMPVPEVTPRNAAIAAVSVGGVVAAVGAAVFLWRATKADQPDYRVVEQDGDFEIREYPALVTAMTEERGPRADALNRGFDTLAGYIFAKTRPGRKISMTAPVLADGSDKSAWRIRFIMPKGEARSDLPNPPAGVTLETEAPRRVAAVRFSGRANDALLVEKEGALRSWLQLRSLPSEAKAEHAFYNSPMMPGPLRRNEILVTLSSK